MNLSPQNLIKILELYGFFSNVQEVPINFITILSQKKQLLFLCTEARI